MRTAIVCLRSISAACTQRLSARCYSVARPEVIQPETQGLMQPPHPESNPPSAQSAPLRSIIPFNQHSSLSPEDMENYELVKTIATATDLESPRLFVHGVGKPLVGDLGAIHPREHRWQPYSALTLTSENDPARRLCSRPGLPVGVFVFLQRKRDFTTRGFILWQKRRALAARRSDQRYRAERLNYLGPELAAAHFVVAHGARVKFFGIDKWYSRRDGNARTMPSRFLETALVEAIDASGSDLIYEGLDNLIGLRHLKSLSLSGCQYIDDWCLPKLLIHAKTLEHLDLSYCPKVTERGLSWLYHLSNLRTLVIQDMPRVENKEYVSLLLEDELPLLEVQGVEYNAVPVQITAQEQRLLEEKRWKEEGIPLAHQLALPGFAEVGNPNVPRSISEKKDQELWDLQKAFSQKIQKIANRKPSDWRP